LASKIIQWIDERFPLSDFTEKHLTKYPTPKNINYLWNFGSVAGAFLVIQIVTGVWLAMYYKADTGLAYGSIEHIMRNVHYGWLIRNLHSVAPTAIFFCIYIHMGRGMYYGSYKGPRELIWWIGVVIYLCFMAESFMGYLLPWGQLSLWGAIVITNLFSAIPVIGEDFTVWLRGDFSVGDATLVRFYSFHTTLLPVAIIGLLLIMHITALHKVGSNNPEGVDLDKKGPNVIPFSPYFVTKDLWFLSLILTIFFYIVFFQPDLFVEPINSEEANPLKTPLHIVPEWYFLPFYAILRSIPDKLGGVVAMFGSIVILLFLPYLDRSPVRSARYKPIMKVLTWIFFLDFVLLGYVGLYPPQNISAFGIEFVNLGRIGTTYYFLYFFAMPFFSSREPTRKLPEMQ
jgi:ubiquinol-cytochrome c reductase cytochrome b subunit